jgi:hypothetical protein
MVNMYLLRGGRLMACGYPHQSVEQVSYLPFTLWRKNLDWFKTHPYAMGQTRTNVSAMGGRAYCNTPFSAIAEHACFVNESHKTSKPFVTFPTGLLHR